MIPANHSLSPNQATWSSHIIYSDDDGETWEIGGVQARGIVNESTVAEIAPGRLYHNMRNYDGSHRRAIAWSADEGLSWTDAVIDVTLIEPVCQASSLIVGATLLFSNPASTSRERMTVRASQDGGETWTGSTVLHEGPAAYSDLTALGDGRIGCLYGRGEEHSYEEIAFMAIAWPPIPNQN